MSNFIISCCISAPFIEGTYDTGYAQQFIEELKENGEFI